MFVERNSTNRNREECSSTSRAICQRPGTFRKWNEDIILRSPDHKESSDMLRSGARPTYREPARLDKRLAANEEMITNEREFNRTLQLLLVELTVQIVADGGTKEAIAAAADIVEANHENLYEPVFTRDIAFQEK